MPRIDHWCLIFQAGGMPYDPPECRNFHLSGFVTGHPDPNVDPGKPAMTSAVRGKREGMVVTESGTEYSLGEPLPQYEEQYPDAKARMLASLTELP